MLIHESGLRRMLKEAWKTSGYTIVNGADEVTIYTDTWLIHTTWDKLPRKALGIIAEQIGYLPTEPGALGIVKDEHPQMVLEDVAGESVASWTRREESEPCRVAPLVLWGMQAFQTDSLRLYGVSRKGLAIVEKTVVNELQSEIWDGNRIGWQEEEEIVVLWAVRPGEEADAVAALLPVWQALEKLDVTGRARAEA